MTGQSLEHRPAKTISICDSDILDTKKRHRYLCRFFVSKISESQMDIVFAGRCSKLCPVIDEDKGLILRLQVHMNNHIRLAIPSNVAKFQSNRYQVATRAKYVVRNHVTLSTGRIAGWKFHHYRLAIQVDGNKVAGMFWTIPTMPNHEIGLVGTGVAITNIIIASHSPGQCQRANLP